MTSPLLKSQVVGRVPMFTTADGWAIDLYRLGLSYHIEDDPADIITAERTRVFTPEEAVALRELVDSLTPDEMETYFCTSVELCQAASSGIL